MSLLTNLKALLPRGWFGDAAPNNDIVLSAPATVLDFVQSLLGYVRKQARIATATDRNLDFIASDLVGTRVSRRDSENDDSLRERIRLEILRPRGTRDAIDRALFDLTGNHPTIFEFNNTKDTGGYGHGNQYMGLAYGKAGGYGSLNLAFQFAVDAYRPVETGGVATVAGYGSPPGGYGVGAIEWITPSQIVVAVSDADILDTINSTKPAATIAWTKINPAR